MIIGVSEASDRVIKSAEELMKVWQPFSKVN